VIAGITLRKKIIEKCKALQPLARSQPAGPRFAESGTGRGFPARSVTIFLQMDA